MTASRTVGNDAFREAMAPVAAALRDFAGAVDEAGPRHGEVAWADSLAMKELSVQRSYAVRTGWEEPLTETHMLSGLTLRAAADYVRTFAEAFTAERPPVYGHLVVARSALESSVICWWLSEPGIARDERVKRGLSELLYSATERASLKIPGDDSAQQVDKWISRAASLGWAATEYNGKKAWSLKGRGKPIIAGVGRPSVREGITALVVGDDESRIGDYLGAGCPPLPM